MPVDPPFTVYRDQLSSLSYGLALWNPDPPKKIYEKVSVGDVGYVHEGAFFRMFNVTLPWDDPSNGLFGIPEPYDHLDRDPFVNTSFSRGEYYSRSVTAETNADDMGGVTYKFRNRGALLYLPDEARSKDVIRKKVFEDYIQDHVGGWFNWAQNNGLAIERIENLILVTGCTTATSWAAAVCMDNSLEAEISLASGTPSNFGASSVWGNVRGHVEYHNSSPQNPLMDQCVFIRGFRAKRALFGIRVIDIGSGRDVLQRSPYRPRNNDLRNASSSLGNDEHGGSSSSLDTIRPINPQLLPYPSSTTLPSNGSVYNESYMTSPSYGSLVEVLDDIAEVRHEDDSDEDVFGEGAFDEYALDDDDEYPLHEDG